jgi:hypothetical protein
MTGFDIADRYDFLLGLLTGGAIAGALELGAPFWALVLILFVASVIGFIRHFDEIMWPSERE